MNLDQWFRVEELFNQVIEMPSAEREEFLATLDGGDEILVGKVKDLVCAEASHNGSFLEAVQNAAEEFLDAPELTEDPPQNIGVYKITRLLGKGGMGAVYLAVRNDEIKRRVAVKIIKRGMDTDDILRRFRNERQILAALEHANITKLIDGGTTDNGLPYLVMEYVDGLPLLEYCESQQLDAKQRLKLFQQICSAVSYAHRNLIVHRDLKPSNIIVTADGVPKLLDFGIAKILNRELSGHTLDPTLTAMRMMTPDYASPEQVRGEQITTASDIYSLGVLLYELLTGQRPYQTKNITQAEMFHAICDTEPPLPSSMITGALGISTNRNTSENRHAAIRNPQSLRGDIDNIVLMSLRKEASRRYASVDQFSEDIQRHLDGLPVLARPNTFSYRVGKFIKRQKVALGSVVFLVTLLAGFGITESIQTRKLAKERDQVQIEKIRAEKIAAFMTELFKSSNPNETNGADLTARQLLDKGYNRLKNELNDQPEVKAKLLLTMAQSYQALSVFDKAEELAEESVRLNRQLYGNENLETLAALEFLGNVTFWAKKSDEAAQIMQEAVNIRRKIGGETIELADSLDQLAVLQKDSLKVPKDEIERNYLEAVSIARRVLPPDDSRLEEYLTDTAAFLLEIRGKFKESENLCREALLIAERNASDNPQDLASAHSCLGRSLVMQARFDEAAQSLETALTIRKDFYKAVENQSLSNAYHNLGYCYLVANQLDKAEPLLQKALQIRTKINSPLRSHSAMELAIIYSKQGKHAEAEELLKTNFIENSKAKQTLYLANILINGGKFAEAEAVSRKNIPEMAKSYGDDHYRYAENLFVLGKALQSQNKAADAAEFLRQSYEIFQKTYGETHPLTIEARNRLK